MNLRTLHGFAAVAFTAMLLIACGAQAATIVFLNGKSLECRVLTKDEATVTIEVTKGNSTEKQVLQLSDIHTVTINGKRHVINEKPNEVAKSASSSGKSSAAKKSTDGREIRTRPEVDALITELGRKPPDWYEQTPLNYPQSLDLTWPAKPPEGWNNQKNVGQYIWDVINPNQNKWKEGVRLMHHLLMVNKDSPEVRTRVMNELGSM